MKNATIKQLLFLVVSVVSIASCSEPPIDAQDETASQSVDSQNEQAFVETLEKHLNAVSNKDLNSLKSTMSPEGKMQLILPGSEIINSVEGFMDYHKEWFQDTSWTFETKILNTEVGNNIGLGITEIIYREPERNGEPYFNRMIVSYGLEKINGKWFVIKDHASSVEKSTDKK